MQIPEAVLTRIRNRTKVLENGHHYCTYSVGSHGYPQVGWKDENGNRIGTTVDRVVWIASNGPIPHGFTVDHRCKDILCINVDHLRLLENFENARRTKGRDWELGKCAQGHDNSYLVEISSSGRMGCSICVNSAKRKWADENKEKRAQIQRDYRARLRNSS